MAAKDDDTSVAENESLAQEFATATSLVTSSGNAPRPGAIFGTQLRNTAISTSRVTTSTPESATPAFGEEEGAVGGMANDQVGDIIEEAGDTVDGAFGPQDGYKGTRYDTWDQVKNLPSVESCVSVFDEKTVSQAFKMNKLGKITEKTPAEVIAKYILEMNEDNPSSSHGKSAIHHLTAHDHGHPKDGSRHVLEVEYDCEECLEHGVEPNLKLK